MNLSHPSDRLFHLLESLRHRRRGSVFTVERLAREADVPFTDAKRAVEDLLNAGALWLAKGGIREYTFDRESQRPNVRGFLRDLPVLRGPHGQVVKRRAE